MPIRPKRAMVLAAGLGLRMGSITEKLPKPMVTVADRTIIDRAIDRLEEVGVETVAVNLHYLGHMIRRHLERRPSPQILFSPEEERLETGGGVARALPLLGGRPFYVVNADALWLNGEGEGALSRMGKAWDGRRMDGLLLLNSTVDAHGYDGVGDFTINQNGALSRRPEAGVAPYLFAGVQILHPRLFANVPEGPFSLNLIYDRAISKGRLHGIVHDGEWFHIGDPEGLAEAEAFMRGIKRG
ncbi:MAG: mannose-1-phosphate guanylyltransferase [Rhodospirillales bacterium RIFCSPLOWO2_12_FULL_58_28]|nr:MAG: mannose-1-phosphate guanylyltransferase [Rhodospirillales bacterium RIFCSPLOWO2_02_FULL_58_16]OHC78215.1 MAG: mannose-1-phosphate guanylyltransferase [Rhodospirillales bacterium RIFCSPLOWO2_12_FULL_58_28]